MKWFIRLLLPALMLASCSEAGESPLECIPAGNDGRTEVVSHGMMGLGRRLENPYSVKNITKALSYLYPTRAGAEVPANALYVRFLPKSAEEFDTLAAMGIEMFDHPLDYEITAEGDYYHDPSIPEGGITWQYAVVGADFGFPDGITHEVIEACYIPEEGIQTRGFEEVDWDAVEALSFKETGNGAMIVPQTRAKAKSYPSGRITVRDEKLGTAVPVPGVKMVANVFVKVSTTYTDAQGNYVFPDKFSARPRYSICFQNKAGFTIGFNLILVAASVSTIGKDDPDGVDVTADPVSDNTLFRRCVVNNAAYDYFQKCSSDGVAAPPKNLRFWIVNALRPSCALMMHHGAVLDTKLVNNYLGIYSAIVRVFAPDVIIGSKGKNNSYAELYSSAVHEMAHASHFSKVGTTYWDNYATYILSSYLSTGTCYGYGSGEYSGYCEVGEMWAYHYENMLYKERYGSNPGHGESYWFHPEILTTLEEGGVGRSEIFSSLKASVTDIDALKSELSSVCSSKKSLITQTFKKYSK